MNVRISYYGNEYMDGHVMRFSGNSISKRSHDVRELEIFFSKSWQGVITNVYGTETSRRHIIEKELSADAQLGNELHRVDDDQVAQESMGFEKIKQQINVRLEKTLDTGVDLWSLHLVG